MERLRAPVHQSMGPARLAASTPNDRPEWRQPKLTRRFSDRSHRTLPDRLFRVSEPTRVISHDDHATGPLPFVLNVRLEVPPSPHLGRRTAHQCVGLGSNHAGLDAVKILVYRIRNRRIHPRQSTAPTPAKIRVAPADKVTVVGRINR